ncbi:hypothetical protein D3C76_1741770 [compost metagenome]
MGPRQQITSHKLTGNFQKLVIHNYDMVAIPANRAADMQQQLVYIHQNGGNFI